MSGKPRIFWIDLNSSSLVVTYLIWLSFCNISYMILPYSYLLTLQYVLNSSLKTELGIFYESVSEHLEF